MMDNPLPARRTSRHRPQYIYFLILAAHTIIRAVHTIIRVTIRIIIRHRFTVASLLRSCDFHFALDRRFVGPDFMPLDSSDFMAGICGLPWRRISRRRVWRRIPRVAATINHLPVVGSIPVTSALLIVKGGVVFAMI